MKMITVNRDPARRLSHKIGCGSIGSVAVGSKAHRSVKLLSESDSHQVKNLENVAF